MSMGFRRSRSRAGMRSRPARRLGGLLAAAAVCLGMLAIATPAHAADGWWRINNYQSGLVANVAEASTVNGAQVIQWPYHDTHWNGQWKRVHVGLGQFQYENRHSHQCLDVNGGNVFNGAPIVQWPCDSSRPSQRWHEFQHPTLPVVHMRSDAATLYMTVENGSHVAGARLIVQPYNQALASQMWTRWD